MYVDTYILYIYVNIFVFYKDFARIISVNTKLDTLQ